MMSLLRRRKRALDDRLAARGLAHTLSLPPFLLHRALLARFPLLRGGSILDAGSGRSPFRERLRELGCEVTAIDVEQRGSQLDLVGDIQHMPEVASCSFDAVVCTQVLEHVPRPWSAFSELARVLRPGGLLVLSVPHLSAIHEAPNDFYRFTRYGLSALARENDLEVSELREVGGLVAFLTHGLRATFIALACALPLIDRVAWLANYLVVAFVFRPIDAILGWSSLYPCNLLIVARKSIAPS